MRCTIAIVGGTMGAIVGFGIGLVGMLLLTQNSGAAIAGGGDGIDALIAGCFCSGIVTALLGAVLGGITTYRLSGTGSTQPDHARGVSKPRPVAGLVNRMAGGSGKVGIGSVVRSAVLAVGAGSTILGGWAGGLPGAILGVCLGMTVGAVVGLFVGILVWLMESGTTR